MMHPKIFPAMLVNMVKLLLKIFHQIHQNIPHYLLYQQQFAKIQPLHFSHVQKQTIISLFFLANLYALGKWESNVNANNVRYSTDPVPYWY